MSLQLSVVFFCFFFLRVLAVSQTQHRLFLECPQVTSCAGGTKAFLSCENPTERSAFFALHSFALLNQPVHLISLSFNYNKAFIWGKISFRIFLWFFCQTCFENRLLHEVHFLSGRPGCVISLTTLDFHDFNFIKQTLGNHYPRVQFKSFRFAL